MTQPAAPTGGWTGRWLSRRAFVLHVLLVVVVPLCLLAGWWQANVAMSGNTLSYVYAVEWPGFACLGVYAWWSLLHLPPAGAGGAPGAAGAVEGVPAAGDAPAPAPGPSGPPATLVEAAVAPDRSPTALDPAPAPPPGPGLAAAGRQRAHPLAALQWEPSMETDALKSYNAYLTDLHVTGRRRRWKPPATKRWRYRTR
jgi:hypothetical protein